MSDSGRQKELWIRERKRKIISEDDLKTNGKKLKIRHIGTPIGEGDKPVSTDAGDKVLSGHTVCLPPGLINLGNTCYMNAALQCLGSAVPLKNYFFDHKDLEEGSIAMEISSLIQQMWNQSIKTSIKPTYIMDKIKNCNERFNGGSQEDSQEFLLCLLEKLHASMKKPYSIGQSSPDCIEADDKWAEYLHKHGDSVVVDLFEGQLQSSMECGECKKTILKFDPFMFLSTPIPHTNNQKLSLLSCLEVMCKEEIFDGKCWCCSKCNQMADVKRKLCISKLPQILMIYIKRFHSDVYGRRSKLNTMVEFPHRDLDLSSFSSNSNHLCLPPKYKLFAVINHSGTIHGGHYTAYANREGQWYYFNDGCVTPSSQEEVISKQAYVLFYAKDEHCTRPNEDKKINHLITDVSISLLCCNFQAKINVFPVVFLFLVILIITSEKVVELLFYVCFGLVLVLLIGKL